jgi:hypothetical protein
LEYPIILIKLFNRENLDQARGVGNISEGEPVESSHYVNGQRWVLLATFHDYLKQSDISPQKLQSLRNILNIQYGRNVISPLSLYIQIPCGIAF